MRPGLQIRHFWVAKTLFLTITLRALFLNGFVLEPDLKIYSRAKCTFVHNIRNVYYGSLFVGKDEDSTFLRKIISMHGGKKIFLFPRNLYLGMKNYVLI